LEVAGFKRLAVVGRGIDAGLFHPDRRSEAVRQQWGLQPTDLAVVYMGRLASEKNLPLVVSTFEAIAERRRDARLVLIGDGPLRESLRAQCPNAIFTGMLRGAELASALASTDLFLFPSETETFGNVVVEAMASGVPTVAYRMAAAGELIDSGVNGWVAEPGCADAFTLAAMVAASNDEQRQAVARRCATDIQGLDWASVTLQFERALLRLVDDQQRLSMAGLNWPSLGAPS
jgi:glycosyltransferase involved in cell wall biosynthesis